MKKSLLGVKNGKNAGVMCCIARSDVSETKIQHKKPMPKTNTPIPIPKTNTLKLFKF